jgi:crotonobetainyl-CoA:carnitine CoA-transferase CaiB-like acyl-CoA transferase
VVETSLYETALSFMTIPIANSMASGRVPGKSGSETPMLAPYRSYQALDRPVIIAAGNDNLFRRLAEVLGHPEWPSDPRFVVNKDRVANRVTLNEAIEEVVGTRPAAHWVAALERVGVPCSLVQDVGEVLAHPQTEALGILRSTPDGAMQLMGIPLRFDGERPDIKSAAPKLGEAIRRA